MPNPSGTWWWWWWFLLTDMLPQHQINPLRPDLNPICRLLALLGAHYIFHVSGLRVKVGDVEEMWSKSLCFTVFPIFFSHWTIFSVSLKLVALNDTLLWFNSIFFSRCWNALSVSSVHGVWESWMLLSWGVCDFMYFKNKNLSNPLQTQITNFRKFILCILLFHFAFFILYMS
jgi:uncharacterized membrane protein YciS (DUF1049 family)